MSTALACVCVCVGVSKGMPYGLTPLPPEAEVRRRVDAIIASLGGPPEDELFGKRLAAHVREWIMYKERYTRRHQPFLRDRWPFVPSAPRRAPAPDRLPWKTYAWGAQRIMRVFEEAGAPECAALSPMILHHMLRRYSMFVETNSLSEQIDRCQRRAVADLRREYEQRLRMVAQATADAEQLTPEDRPAVMRDLAEWGKIEARSHRMACDQRWRDLEADRAAFGVYNARDARRDALLRALQRKVLAWLYAPNGPMQHRGWRESVMHGLIAL